MVDLIERNMLLDQLVEFIESLPPYIEPARGAKAQLLDSLDEAIKKAWQRSGGDKPDDFFLGRHGGLLWARNLVEFAVLGDIPWEQLSTASYQVRCQLVDAFQRMWRVYNELSPTLRENADALMELMGNPETSDADRTMAVHTLMELLLLA
jgi:hypothetical protein